MRTAVFSFLTVSALCLGAMGIYSADAASERATFDGYGISAAAR